nr:VRR-NUC domain-containing protein [Sphingomonas kaistensis]
MSEIAIVTLFRSRAKIVCPGVSIVAVPNAAKRTQWAAARAKREGMATGFPDLMAIAPGKIAFLEIKTAKGRVSAHQGEWLDRLHAMGFPCGVFRDADSALEFLRHEGFPFFGRLT